jgi:hypothetical protein
VANFDTLTKRFSGMGLATFDPPLLPAPDATLAAIDRLHLLDLYGMAVAGSASFTLTATPGSYSITGTAATLTKSGGKLLTATPGSYAIAGTAATLRIGHKLTASASSYAITGPSVTFIKSAAAPRLLTTTSGAYLISGTAATLTYSAIITLDRYASYDLDTFADLYDGRVANSADLTLSRELADPLWNANPTQGMQVSLRNGDGALTEAYYAGLTGRAITLSRYDVRTGALAVKFTGQVTWPSLAEHTLELECAALDDALWLESIPEPVVDTDTFPNAHVSAIGKTIQVVFGTVPNVPAYWVSDDKVNSVFDCLVGHGTLAVTGLQYAGPQKGAMYSVQFIECIRADGAPAASWAEVARTDLYPGYTAVRFTLRQQDFNNELVQMYASVTGGYGGRNFARAIKRVLDNVAAWGLGQAVNDASFDAAEALLNTLPVPLYCDGVLLEPRRARDVLSELMLVRGMRLALNSLGEITIAVDTPRTTIAMAISDDPVDGPRNRVASQNLSGPTPEERIRKVVVSYRYDYVNGKYLQKARRTIGTAGQKREVLHPFLRDASSADCVADYLSKRILYGQQGTLPITVTQEGRALDVGDLVSVTKASQGINATVMEVWKISERLTSLALTLRGYHWSLYSYTPSALPADAIGGTETDTSRTIPSAGALIFASSSTSTPVPGAGVTASLTYTVGLPTENISAANLLYRLTGATLWSIGAILQLGDTAGRLEGLSPGTPYDVGLQVIGANPANVSSITTDLSRLTATDSTVPSAPGAAPVVTNPKPGSHLVIDQGTPPVDWAFTICYRNTTNTSAGAVEVARGQSSWFLDQTATYNQQFFFFLRYADTTGNLSPFSPSGTSGALGATKTINFDIGTGAVTTGKIGSGEVATPNIATNATSAPMSATHGGGAGFGAGVITDVPGLSLTPDISSASSSVLVMYSGDFTFVGATTTVRFKVHIRNGSGGILKTVFVYLDNYTVTTASNFPVAITYTTTGLVGSNTFKVSVEPIGLTSMASLNGHNLDVLEIKR